MFWHIETDVVCLIIMAAMFVDLRKRDFSTMHQDSVFRRITMVTICCIVIDIAASLGMDYVTSWWLYQILNILYFATLPVLPMMWFHYICTVIYPNFTLRSKKIMALCMLPGIAFSFICLTNPATGLIFNLSSDMVYERGKLFAGAYLMLAFYTLASFIIVIIKRKKIVPRSRIPLLLSFFVIVAIAVYFQISYPGILVVYAAYTINFVIVYYYIQNRTAFTDSLTGLYSRATGEQRVNDYILKHEGEGSMAFIITDLDHFKTINDTYGHKQGDVVLRTAASACMEAFPTDAVLSRLGGDEFLILYINYSDHEDLNRTLASVGTIMREKLMKVAPQCAESATISMGVALFPEHGSNFMELYENADIALYQSKWMGRNRFGIFNANESIRDPKSGEDKEEKSYRESLFDNGTEVSMEKTMMIIEDNESDRNALENVFKDDFFILRAEDAVSALRLLRRHGISIDVILLSLTLPGKDGYDFLAEKMAYTPCKNVPVIAIATNDDEKTHVSAEDCGVIDVVTKPIDPEELKNRVKDVLKHYGEGFSYNDYYQRELLNLANTGIQGGMICVYNEKGHPLEYISTSFIDFLGYENHHELFVSIDGKWDNIIYDLDLENTLKTVSEQLEHGKEYTKLEYRLKRKGGGLVWVRDSGKIIRSNAGQDIILALCIDITDTMKLKEKQEDK